MIIRDSKNRPYIEKTEDELKLYRITGRRIFKLEKLKAIYLIKNNKLAIFYENEYEVYSVKNRKDEDYDQLVELIESINSREIIFYCTGVNKKFYMGMAIYWIVFSIFICSTTNNDSMKYYWGMLIIFWVWILFTNLKRANYFEYNIVDGIINLKDSIRGQDYFIDVLEDFSMTYKNRYRGYFYFLNNNKKKIAIEDNVIIPEFYKQEIKKIYEIKKKGNPLN